MTQPPPPLEWHPWYRDKTWLLDWLESQGTYGDLHCVKIVVPQPTPWNCRSADVSTDSSQMRIMSRTKAFGPAPYVGRPFMYAWPVGRDDLGRYIAGESQRVYRS